MLCLPSSLNELLLLFAPCFTKPTFQTFQAMILGQISQTRLRCVTGMLIGARLSGVWHHARAHRYFSSARWCADELGLRVAEVIVSRLLDAGAPLGVPIDDTLAKRRGRKVFGCFWHHDATANSSKGSLAWGNNWVTAGINVKLPFLERTEEARAHVASVLKWNPKFTVHEADAYYAMWCFPPSYREKMREALQMAGLPQ